MEDDIDKFIKKIKEIVIKYKFIVICIILITAVISLFIYFKQDKDIINISNDKETKEGDNSLNNDNLIKTQEKDKIVVHIAGEVKNKGVYTVESNYRLNDLVNLAGGLTSNADETKINLAKKLNDGEKVYIYAKGELNINEMQDIKEDDENQIDGKVNINTATKSELTTLPGIGKATADKIINHRKSNGNFKKIEDIKKVNGIGDSKFENIKDLIDV